MIGKRSSGSASLPIDASPQPPKKKLSLTLSRSTSCPDKSITVTSESSQPRMTRSSLRRSAGVMPEKKTATATVVSCIVIDDGDTESIRNDTDSASSSEGVSSPTPGPGACIRLEDVLKCPFCPSCQMPLLGRESAWSNRHIQDCLDFPSKPTEECPNGEQCTLSLPAHFRKYRHLALAARRCNATLATSSSSVATNGMEKTSRGAIEVIGPLPQPSPEKKTTGYSVGHSSVTSRHKAESVAKSAVGGPQMSIASPASGGRGQKSSQQGTLSSFFGLKAPASAATATAAAIAGPEQSLSKPQQGVPWGGLMSRPHQTRASASSQSQSHTASRDTSHAHSSAAADETDGAAVSSFSGKQRKQCPFYKKIPGTCFTVDAFSYGSIEGCKAYFLSHFHSDHYQGLTKSFSNPIYCSKATGNLCISQLRVKPELIHNMKMYEPINVHGVVVTLVDANHCPGSVMFIFQLPDGRCMLHTGDFRSADSVIQDPHLHGLRYDTIYLDTTYLDPKYDFPPQDACVQFAVAKAKEAVAVNPKTLIVSGTYSIGKERIFLAVAEALGSKVAVTAKKKAILDQLEWSELTSRLTTNWSEAQVHVLPMMQINFKGMKAHLQAHGGSHNHILGFRPTGWTQTNKTSVHGTGSSMPNILPSFQEGMILYGIPYSEHSSFSELRRFVQHFRPRLVQPTVNVGSASSRDRMQSFFRQWLS